MKMHMWTLVNLHERNVEVPQPTLLPLSDQSNEAEVRNLLNIGRPRFEWIKIWGLRLSTPTKVLTDARQEIDRYLGLWKPVSPKPVLALTREAARFMEENNLTNFLALAGDIMASYLKAGGIQSWAWIVELARDIEAPFWEALKIRVEIEGKSYAEILDIWERICKDFYEELSKDVAKKFYIVMRRTKRR